MDVLRRFDVVAALQNGAGRLIGTSWNKDVNEAMLQPHHGFGARCLRLRSATDLLSSYIYTIIQVDGTISRVNNKETVTYSFPQAT